MLRAVLDIFFSMGSYVGALIILVVIFSAALRIIPEYQRGVVFRLGRYVGTKGPGLVIVIPVIDKLFKADLRVVTLDVPYQEVITKDNVPVKVNAVVYFRVIDPAKSVIEIENYMMATGRL